MLGSHHPRRKERKPIVALIVVFSGALACASTRFVLRREEFCRALLFPSKGTSKASNDQLGTHFRAPQGGRPKMGVAAGKWAREQVRVSRRRRLA